MLVFFHCVDICTDGTKTMVSKTAGSLPQFKAVEPNCTPCTHRSARTVKVPNSIKNAI